MKVLTVDDNPMTGILLNDTLIDMGHHGFTAADADSALELYVREMPHVCILDWMMPGTDGLELACSIRKQGGAAVYIMMLTAKRDSEDIELAYRLGVDEFLSKPVVIEELKARLRTVARLVGIEERCSEQCAQIAALTAQLAQTRRAA